MMAAHITLAWEQCGLAELEKQGHLGARKPAAPAPGLTVQTRQLIGTQFPFSQEWVSGARPRSRLGRIQRVREHEWEPAPPFPRTPLSNNPLNYEWRPGHSRGRDWPQNHRIS